MSLNPYKCSIAVKRGILLGHVVSAKRISIDGKKVVALQKVRKLFCGLNSLQDNRDRKEDKI